MIGASWFGSDFYRLDMMVIDRRDARNYLLLQET